MLKKILKWTGIAILSIISLLIIGLLVTGNGYILKAVRVVYLTGHSSAFIDDHIYFDNRPIAVSNPQPWAMSPDYNKTKKTEILDSVLQSTGSIAYLIIKNDSIWFEEYYGGYNKDSQTNSFSMAKSIVAAALGKALELGYIKSLDEKVITYLPELKGQFSEGLTIRNLVSMQSGLQWDESYTSPFSITTKAYFYNDLSKAMLELPISSQPGQNFKYQSGDTQLLTMVLNKALPVSLSEFVSTNFWKTMGAENEALWQINEADGIEKGYCCIASNARDFARFGRLYMNRGNWNGSQLLDSNYIELSTQAVDVDNPVYGYGWWLTEYNGKKVEYMDGHLGQYVITIPKDDIIIIRLGHRTDRQAKSNPNSAFYQYIDQAYTMLGMQ